tara:strand:+ start:886 stop:1137 length:252 start_codon:yes stop_codon:yes gene_type:complete
MKLTQRLDVVVLVLLFLFLLTGCTTTEVLDTMSKFNQDKPLYDKHGCREDEVYWCEGHDRRNADCMCIERTIMENRLHQLRRM